MASLGRKYVFGEFEEKERKTEEEGGTEKHCRGRNKSLFVFFSQEILIAVVKEQIYKLLSLIPQQRNAVSYLDNSIKSFFDLLLDV